MARQKRRGAASPKESAHHTSLADALAATAQHSVPLLPAHAAKQPQSPGDSTARATTTSYARRTLAPLPSAPVGTAPRAAASWTPDKPTSRRRARPRRASTLPPVEDDSRDAGEPQEEAPGRPTIVLPSMTSAQLPAIIPEEQRALDTAREPGAPALLIRGAKTPPRLHLPPLAPRRRGARPFAVQFLLSMGTVMVLFTTLTLASPLGHGNAFATAFQAYANAVPWVAPTPTPKPTPRPYVPPVGANPGQQAVINEIVAVFGGYSQGALNVARCESGYDPNARNPYAIGNSHASGVFQILYPSTWDTTSYAAQSPFDYVANIHAAYQIFSRDGHTWAEWACQP